MYVVVAYDIGSDRRRARLYELLLGYGSPVQRSVFECALTADQLRRLQRAAARLARGRGDSIRYYLLCGACQERTRACGTALVDTIASDYVV